MTTPEYGSLRSDDDHWDIVSNVGYTALLVAGWRALHTTGPKPLVQDEYAKHFITASADPYLEGLLANPRTSEDGTAFPRLSSYRGSARDHQVRVGADKEILMQTNWARHISVRQVEVA